MFSSTFLSRSSLLAATAGLFFTGAGAHATPLRINPYLQKPSSDGVLMTWFTDVGEAGTLTVNGPGLAAPQTFTSAPSVKPVLQYTQAERTQAADLGYRLLSDKSYKHSADIRGLQPGQTYNYTLNQSGERFSSSFKVAPTNTDWESVRFVAFSDSETEPRGNTRLQTWAQSPQAAGSLGRPDGLEAYPLTETVGYQQNLRIVGQRNPDFIVMPGDLVQGGGYQLGWDEFFRHNAGEYDSPLSQTPILPALGNWENFGALNDGYTIDPANGINAPKFGRDKYKTYFDMPENGTPEHQDNYYRTDYGPVTLLTLDSSNGEPDQMRRVPTALDVDTQTNINVADYNAAGGNDLSDFNPGSAQWNWVVDQLEDARAQGQLIFAQWHHSPYSSGTHSLPNNHPEATGQSGTPMRVYTELFEDYGVTAVFNGHSELYERSFVDLDGDGQGIQFFEIGAAGDGLRGPRSIEQRTELNLNPFSQFMPNEDAPENWVEMIDEDGNVYITLEDGGKHYGHIEVNIMNVSDIYDDFNAMVEFLPVYSFPVLDENFNLVGDTERRIYDDIVRMLVRADGSYILVSEPATLAGFAFGGIALMVAMRRRRRIV